MSQKRFASRALLLALTLAASLGVVVDARDAVVVRDAWTARWTDGRKSSWTHLRIEHHPDASPSGVAYVVSRVRTSVVDGDARWTVSEETTTDAEGRVLRHRAVDEAPWGTTVVEVAAIDTAIHWKRRVRAYPPEEGWFAGPIWDADVFALRLLEASTADVETEVAVLRRTPTPRVSTTSIEVQDEATRVRVAGHVWTRDGRVLPSVLRAGSVVSGPTTRERAGDLEESAPPVERTEPGRMELPGLRLRDPGPEWRMIEAGRDDMQLSLAYVLHPTGTTASALVEDGRMVGSTAEERLRFAFAVRAKFGDHALADPEPCTWRGRQGFRFPVRMSFGAVEMTGDLVLVDLGTARATVWTVQPTDLRASRSEDLRRALEAIELVDVARTWQRAALGEGTTVEIPGHWIRDGQEQLRASSHGSWVKRAKLPMGGRSLEDALEEQRARPHRLGEGVTHVEELRELRDVDGRRALVVVDRVGAPVAGGNTMRARCGFLLVDCGDGDCEVVWLMAFEHELVRAEVDRILSSVRWSP